MNFIQNLFQHKESVAGNFQRQACVKGTNIRIGIVNPNERNSMIEFCSENLKPFCGPYHIFSDIIQEDATNYVFLLGAVKDGKLVTLHPDNKANGKQLHFKTYSNNFDTQHINKIQKPTLWRRLSQPGQRRLQDLAAKREAQLEKDALRIMIDSDCIQERIVTKNFTPDSKVRIINSSARQRVPWEYYTVDNHYIKKSIIRMHKSTPVATSRTNETLIEAAESSEEEQEESVESCPGSARPVISDSTKSQLFKLFGTMQSSSLQQEKTLRENVDSDTMNNTNGEIGTIVAEHKDSNETDCEASQSNKSFTHSPTSSVPSNFKIDNTAESSEEESVGTEKLDAIFLSLIRSAKSPLNVDIVTDVESQSEGDQVLKFMAVNDNIKVPLQVMSNSGDALRESDCESTFTVSSFETELIDNLFRAIYEPSATDTESVAMTNATFSIMPSSPIQKTSEITDLILEKCKTSELCVSNSSLDSHSTNSMTNNGMPSNPDETLENKLQESQPKFYQDLTINTEQFLDASEHVSASLDTNEMKIQESQTENLTIDSETVPDQCITSIQHFSASDEMLSLSNLESIESKLQTLETGVNEDLLMDLEKVRNECDTSTPTKSLINGSTEAITDTTFIIDESQESNGETVDENTIEKLHLNNSRTSFCELVYPENLKATCNEEGTDSTTEKLHLNNARTSCCELVYSENLKATCNEKGTDSTTERSYLKSSSASCDELVCPGNLKATCNEKRTNNTEEQSETINSEGDAGGVILTSTAVQCTQTESKSCFVKQQCIAMLMGENFSKNAATIKYELQGHSGNKKSGGASSVKPGPTPWWIRLSNAKSPPERKRGHRTQSRTSSRGTESSPHEKSGVQGKTYRVCNDKTITE